MDLAKEIMKKIFDKLKEYREQGKIAEYQVVAELLDEIMRLMK